jgi:hypothetical protein
VTGYKWKPGVNEAKCNNYPDHVPPVEYDESRAQSCGCGMWGYWEIADQNWITRAPVLGVIRGTGRVLIGTKGFRAQRAEIIALAPAFVIQANTGSERVAPFSFPRDQYSFSRDPYSYRRPYQQNAEELAREAELREERAAAWMALVMDDIGQMYPGARVFATVRGMLASVPPGEFT